MNDKRVTVKFNEFLDRAFERTRLQKRILVGDSPTAAVEEWARCWLEHNQPRYVVEHFFRNPRNNKRREFNDLEDALEYLTDYDGNTGWQGTLDDRQTGESVLLPDDLRDAAGDGLALKARDYIEQRNQ